MKKQDRIREVAVIIGFCLALALFVTAIYFAFYAEKDEPALPRGAVIRISAPLALVEAAETAETAPAEEAISDPYINLGEYKLTAYCACERCCGAYGANRPIGEDGKSIVYTASMAVAKQGVTIAADTSIHPFGTVLKIDGIEYTVQDRGGAVKGKHVDIYFESHDEARKFGVQYRDVLLKEGA